MTKKEEVDKYLEMSGQDFQDLMAGAEYAGTDKLFDELVPKALAEKKKIVFEEDGRGLGSGTYVLQDLL